MIDAVSMIANSLVDLTDECIQEVIQRFPMLVAKREAVVDWTTNEPWGGTLHRITVANTQIATFEVGCRATGPTTYGLYRKGPSFCVEPEDAERLLQEI